MGPFQRHTAGVHSAGGDGIRGYVRHVWHRPRHPRSARRRSRVDSQHCPQTTTEMAWWTWSCHVTVWLGLTKASRGTRTQAPLPNQRSRLTRARLRGACAAGCGATTANDHLSIAPLPTRRYPVPASAFDAQTLTFGDMDSDGMVDAFLLTYQQDSVHPARDPMAMSFRSQRAGTGLASSSAAQTATEVTMSAFLDALPNPGVIRPVDLYVLHQTAAHRTCGSRRLTAQVDGACVCVCGRCQRRRWRLGHCTGCISVL